MADTTIGYAVLQIIPSLKGVSEAIEKQIAGKTVPVTIEPKTDAAKVDKSIKDAVKKKPVEVPVTPKVDQKQLDKELAATKDKILKGAKDWDSFNKANAEKWAKEQAAAAKSQADAAKAQVKDLSKAITEAKIEMPQIETRGLGTKLRDAIIGGLREINNNPALQGIPEQLGQQVGAAIGQKIGDAIRESPVGKAITDAVDTARPAIEGVRGALQGIQERDAGKALGGVADAMRGIGQSNAANVIGDFGTKVGAMQTDVATLKTNIEGTATQFASIAGNSPKAAEGLRQMSAAAGPLAGVFVALTQFMPGFSDSLNKIQAGKGTWKDWLEAMLPVSEELRRIETSLINIARQGPPRVDTSLPALRLPPYTGPNTSPPAVDPHSGAPLPAPPRAPNVTDIPTFQPPTDHASGGQIHGAGSGVSDSILARVSNGEFIVNANATRKNLPLLEVINSDKLPGFEGGGLVAGAQQLRKIIAERFGIADIGGYRPGGDGFNEHSTGRALDVMVGNDKAKGDAVKDFALANASAIDLKWAIWRQHLYYPGGGGYDMADRGSPTQNHMDHVHIFSGPGISNGLLGALQGSTAPNSKGDAKNVGDSAAAPAAAASAGVTPASSAAGAGGSSGGSSGGFSIPSSFGDLAGFGLSGLGVKTKVTPSSPERTFDLGGVASAAIGGQVSSALGAFGIPGAPHWLGAASQVIGGIKVGGGASPASTAIPAAGAASIPGPAGVPDSVSAAKRPGSQTIFNIQTDRVQDAFIRADHHTKELAMSKLGPFI